MNNLDTDKFLEGVVGQEVFSGWIGTHIVALSPFRSWLYEFMSDVIYKTRVIFNK